MRAIFPFLFLLIWAPLLQASAPFEAYDSIEPGSFATLKHRRYVMHLEEGETVVATLEWTLSSSRLFLDTSRPSNRCSFDPECAVNSVMTNGICGTSTGPGVYSSPQTVVLQAREAGEHHISVMTFLTVARTSYHITIALEEGGAERVEGPLRGPGGVNGTPVHCIQNSHLPPS